MWDKIDRKVTRKILKVLNVLYVDCGGGTCLGNTHSKIIKLDPEVALISSHSKLCLSKIDFKI